MKLTITIPIPKITAIPRFWRWGLLAALIVALMFTWSRQARQPAQAGPVPGLIIIEKVDRDTGGKIGPSCFQLLTELQEPVFEVCDNGPGDMDPTPGWIQFQVPGPGLWHVVETVPPPGYNLKDIKYECFFDPGGFPPCLLIVPNDGKSQININKIGQYVPPKSCYNVFDALNQPPPLFQVCDNDWQGAPAQSTICVPDAVCNDEDPAVGSIRVTVIPRDYHVVESKPPPNHTADATKHECDAIVGSKCDVTVVDAPIVRPWHPWDLTGAPGGGPDGLVRVADILAVVQHYHDDKPLP